MFRKIPNCSSISCEILSRLFRLPVHKKVRFMVFYATFNNISVLSQQSVLLVKEIRVLRENLFIKRTLYHLNIRQIGKEQNSPMYNTIAAREKLRIHCTCNSWYWVTVPGLIASRPCGEVPMWRIRLCPHSVCVCGWVVGESTLFAGMSYSYLIST